MHCAIAYINILLLFISGETFCQITPLQLMGLSEKYYLTLERFSIRYESRFKNMINIDTLSHFTQCYIDKTSDVMIFFSTIDNAYVKTGSDEYSVYNYQGSLVHTKTKNKVKKYSAYESEFKHLPFTATGALFEELSRKINNQSNISQTDSTYLVQSHDIIIALRKSDYSIKSITEFVYDRINKGVQFSQILFGIINTIDSSGEESIRNTISIINDPLTNTGNLKKEPRAEHIEVSLLEKNLTTIVNGKIESIKNKTVFLDFFFQGCFPCVKSYPYVNSLFNSADSNLVVIGVDQLLRDTSTIDKYIEKYNLQYPILIGQPAVFLTQYFKLHLFPTFIIIGSDGRIIEYGYGFTKSSFRKLTKKIISMR